MMDMLLYKLYISSEKKLLNNFSELSVKYQKLNLLD